jgi:hypothetical protein
MIRYTLCKVHRPDSGARPQVQDSLGLGFYRREMKLAIEDHSLYVLHEVHPVLLLLVLRLTMSKPILPGSRIGRIGSCYR